MIYLLTCDILGAVAPYVWTGEFSIMYVCILIKYEI